MILNKHLPHCITHKKDHLSDLYQLKMTCNLEPLNDIEGLSTSYIHGVYKHIYTYTLSTQYSSYTFSIES